MIGAVMLGVRAIVSLAFLAAITWQAPIVPGIMAFVALVGVQLVSLARAIRWAYGRTGRDLRPALRALALEAALAVAVNAIVIRSAMWAGAHFG